MLTATQMARLVQERATPAVELCNRALAEIERLDGGYGAFLQIFPDEARARAQQIDELVRQGRPIGPLAGVPFAVKDNICTSTGRTTCGSRILEHYRSPFDATVIRRLSEAGAVLLGKTNLDEFAMGGSTENSALKKTVNPWDARRVPGGSSGGSAVAVATGMIPVALGSDTGGSVRQPAGFCGVVGLKPSYGRVSRYGLVSYGSSLDQIGPLARTVTDAALVLQAMAGHDALDTTSAAQEAPDFVQACADEALAARPRPLRVGLPRDYLTDGLDPASRAALLEAVDVYRKLGAEVVDVSLPHAPYCIATYYLIATAEASSNLARFDGVHFGLRADEPRNIQGLYGQSRSAGFGAEVKRRIMLGTFALSAGYYDAYYDKALRVRRLIAEDYTRAFEQVDVLTGPLSPSPAFRFGEKCNDPLQMYLADLYTVSANLAGIPAIAVPCGFTEDGLPLSLQLQAAAFDEITLLKAARLYERETNWVMARSPVTVRS